MKEGGDNILISELKQQLDSSKIELILESLDCHHIAHHSSYISAGLPDGDNINSITVYTDSQQYNSMIHTRSEFQTGYNVKDFISIVQFIRKSSFPGAMKYICQQLNIDYYANIEEPAKPALLSFLDFVETGHKEETEIDRVRVLPESVLNQFIKLPSQQWLSEGISIDSQKLYEVGFDPMTERITFPIRDATGTLLGVKGRTINPEDESKYLYIYSAPKASLLYGEYQNTEAIKKANECIVVEAAKSVMKLNSLGFKNAVSIEGKSLSEIQAQNLQRLNVPITIALDQGVTDVEINEIVKRLQYPVQFQPINVIKDSIGLYLQDKESPCDNKDSWIDLYNNFKETV